MDKKNCKQKYFFRLQILQSYYRVSYNKRRRASQIKCEFTKERLHNYQSVSIYIHSIHWIPFIVGSHRYNQRTISQHEPTEVSIEKQINKLL